MPAFTITGINISKIGEKMYISIFIASLALGFLYELLKVYSFITLLLFMLISISQKPIWSILSALVTSSLFYFLFGIQLKTGEGLKRYTTEILTFVIPCAITLCFAAIVLCSTKTRWLQIFAGIVLSINIVILLLFFPAAYNAELKHHAIEQNHIRHAQIWQNFCATQTAKRPPHYQPLYTTLREPADIYLRYGEAATPALQALIDDLITNKYLDANGRRPVHKNIRCLEEENTHTHKFIPQLKTCPDFNDFSEEGTPTSPQSRYHLIVGEDDANNVISEASGESGAAGIPETLELHTVRLLDSATGTTLATAPIAISNIGYGNFADEDRPACRYYTDVMRDVIEQVFVAPEERNTAE